MPRPVTGLTAAVATPGRRRLLGATLALAVVAAVGLTVVAGPTDRTLAATSEPAQSLVSVLVPFLGVLLGAELRRSRTRVGATLASAVLAAVACALAGTAAAALTVGLTSDRWDRAVAIGVGGVAVQVLAQLVGTGLGLLIGSRPLAMAATIVLPLGLWALLGAIPGLDAARPWLTPFAWVPTLLTGSTPPTGWAPYVVVVALWAAGLNTLGLLRLRRRT